MLLCDYVGSSCAVDQTSLFYQVFALHDRNQPCRYEA